MTDEERMEEAERLVAAWATQYNSNSKTFYPIDLSEGLACQMFCEWLLKHHDLTEKKRARTKKASAP